MFQKRKVASCLKLYTNTVGVLRPISILKCSNKIFLIKIIHKNDSFLSYVQIFCLLLLFAVRLKDVAPPFKICHLYNFCVIIFLSLNFFFKGCCHFLFLLFFLFLFVSFFRYKFYNYKFFKLHCCNQL